ncbi:MAG: hypothetical protein ACRDWA_15320 [Acidimicrobiia bacterium]
MSPAQMAGMAAALTIGLAAVVIMAFGPAEGARVIEVLSATAVLGGPLAAATAATTYAFATTRGRDFSERLLLIATRGPDEFQSGWGAAMRAELATLEMRRERRRFAIDCCLTALRIATGRAGPTVALMTVVLSALATFGGSRAALAGDRSGIVQWTLWGPIIVLFAIAFVTALTKRSFGAGLVTGALALVATLIGTTVVTMVEGGHWFDIAGIYVMDGDVPKAGFDRTDAILDPASPPFLILHLLVWLPWPVLGAAFGSRRRGEADDRMRATAQPSAS